MKTPQRLVPLFALIFLFGSPEIRSEECANIVVLFADDMGFSDIGSFGSEIETPNLDRLAANGLRYTHFYNTGRCCPSRASILTGLYSHQADIGHMAGDLGVKGYRDRLSFESMTMAEVLGASGYHTIMTGKWHLGWRDEGSPTARGFQHFYGTRGYIDSYYTIVPRTEIYLGGELVLPVTETPVNHLKPKEEWYTTDVFTDYALHFIDQVREQEGNRAVRDGDWKLVGSRNEPWELYDMSRDRTEGNDLMGAKKEMAKELQAKREGWAAKVNVLTPDEFERTRKEHNETLRKARAAAKKAEKQ